MDNQNYYDKKFNTSLVYNDSLHEASQRIIEAYLDNKPAGSKNKKVSPTERDQLFWHSELWQVTPSTVYNSEAFVLALTRYFSQDVVSNFPLLKLIASESPLSVKNAVRYSELALKPNTNKWQEFQQLTESKTHEFDELIAIIKLMHKEHEILLMDLEQAQRKLSSLSPLTCLIYISLFAFEHLLGQHSEVDCRLPEDNKTTEAWTAFKNIVAWKLENTKIEDFNLTEKCIFDTVKEHLIPFLFPSAEQKINTTTYQNISDLIIKQIALNSFISQSAHAFCFDDSIAFKLKKGIAVIEVANEQLNLDWKNNGHKLQLLDSYWLNRGADELIASGMAEQQIGSAENHDINQFAMIKTLSNQLRLIEVYGLNEYLTADSGLRVKLHEVLLSLNLMSAFYNKAFIAPYQQYLYVEKNWLAAISRLAFEGLKQGENRFPITWSFKKDKVGKFKDWTVNETFPNGNLKAAEAIIDFWSFDLKTTAKKLQSNKLPMVIMPELYERPIFTLGNHLFEFPWMVAFQNNSTATINNLRRVGAGRTEARAETAAIEARLADILKSRGFTVLLNYQPEKTPERDPGEIDIICALEGHILVLEVKSTFLRSSKKDAWFHKTRTLRKAGKQISRKVRAVEQALLSDEDFKSTLGLDTDGAIPKVIGWIVDTSVELDHQLFSDYLKISLEEIIIALRDDSHLLFNMVDMTEGKEIKKHAEFTLYPNGFSINNFLGVIEHQRIWQVLNDPDVF
jgi:Holliday junction resolvase-like predicted endonuclease